MPDSSVHPAPEASPEASLMKLISTRFGALIAESVAGTRLPAAFLAALIANESAGDANAKRFEPKHFAEIMLVLSAQKVGFDPTGLSRVLGPNEILRYVSPDPAIAGVRLTFQQSLARAVQLSTSWGLTQIMGWNFLEQDRTNWLPPAPDKQLQMTMILLTIRASFWHLDVGADPARGAGGDHEKLFASWNAWVPDPAKTYDPQYCAKGLSRMAIYDTISRAASPAADPSGTVGA